MNVRPDIKERIMVALDVDSLREASKLVELLAPHVGYFKVGLQLFSNIGPDAVWMVNQLGGRVFLDLKLHDIKNTVEKAALAGVELGVSFFDVHASNSVQTLQAAVAVRRDAKVLAITVLTDIDDVESGDLFGQACKPTVTKLALRAKNAGAQGVVCSVLEAEMIRALSNDFIIVTPGIRLATGAKHDQVRVATPYKATKAGADHLVLGRAVTDAIDPIAALAQVADEIEQALEELAAARV